jgi:hypothetical protein
MGAAHLDGNGRPPGTEYVCAMAQFDTFRGAVLAASLFATLTACGGEAQKDEARDSKAVASLTAEVDRMKEEAAATKATAAAKASAEAKAKATASAAKANAAARARAAVHRVDVQVTLTDRTQFGGKPCGSGDFGPYAGFHSGTQMVIQDEAGSTLATSPLGDGTYNGVSCIFEFQFSEVPRAEFYGVRQLDGREGNLQYSYQELVASNWHFYLDP